MSTGFGNHLSLSTPGSATIRRGECESGRLVIACQRLGLRYEGVFTGEAGIYLLQILQVPRQQTRPN